MKTFKVLQFNMQFGQVWDDAHPDDAPIDLEQTIAEIRRHDADVVLLQEVERGEPGGARPDPPPNYTRLRAALSGYDSFFACPRPDPRELPFGVGLAIFSRTALRDTVRHDLPSPPIEFEFRGRRLTPTDRILIGARTTLLGETIEILNTHLLALFMITSETENYPLQRRRVVELANACRAPALVGGDFNVLSHDALASQFAAAGYQPVQTERVTWRRAPYVLDHIFYNGRLRLARCAVIPTPASDHHAVLAEFGLSGE